MPCSHDKRINTCFVCFRAINKPEKADLGSTSEPILSRLDAHVVLQVPVGRYVFVLSEMYGLFYISRLRASQMNRWIGMYRGKYVTEEAGLAALMSEVARCYPRKKKHAKRD